MRLSDYPCFGFILLVLLVFAVWWLLMRLGYDKRWFVMPSEPFISRGFYFFLPSFILGFGIGFVDIWQIALDPYSDKGTPLLLIGFGLWGLGFVFAYLEPNWLSPDWYRWLKREHSDILPYLEREANRLGRTAWLKQVQTQEGLEAWVAEVRRKHNLPQ